MNSGAYSAICNAVASISAGITPTIMGAVIDVAGWSAYYYVTFALVGFVCIALAIIDVVVRLEYRKAHNMTTEQKI